MRGAQTWTGPLDLDVKDLQRAIRATGAALGVPITVQRERVDGPTLDKVATETHGRVVLEEFDDDGQQNIVIDIGSPLPIHGEIMLQGCSLEYYSDNVTEPVEGFYLFVAHFATALGFKPEPMHYTDQTGSWRAAVSRYLQKRLEGVCGKDAILAIEQPGAVGPLAVEARREPPGVVVDVRGAGSDVRVSITTPNDTADTVIARAHELQGDEEFRASADSWRREALKTLPPPREPRFGGQLVLHVWEDGVRVRSDVVDLPDTLEDAEQAGDGALADLVWYFSDGTPQLRTIAEGPDMSCDLDELTSTPDWRWAPGSLAEVEAMFRHVAGPAPPAPPAAVAADALQRAEAPEEGSWEALLAEIAEEADVTRRQPVTSEELAGVVQRLGVELPPDYVRLVTGVGAFKIAGGRRTGGYLLILRPDELEATRASLREHWIGWAPKPGPPDEDEDVEDRLAREERVAEERETIRDDLGGTDDPLIVVLGDEYDRLRVVDHLMWPLLQTEDGTSLGVVCVGPHGRLYLVHAKWGSFDLLGGSFEEFVRGHCAKYW